MLVFSGCKINLGLNVLEKRNDGFHNIETVFFPLKWNDALEVLENTENQSIKLSFSGYPVIGSESDNIVVKAYDLIKKNYHVPGVKVHLHKNIPMGAGLGGGSSNASSFINLMDMKFDLKIPLSKKLELAKQLGSDCAFFIENKAVFAKEKGDVFESVKVDLSNYYILVVYPNVHSNTKMAYQGITPQKPKESVKTILETKPIDEWRTLLVNDFENSVFKNLPQIKKLKQKLYDSGAVYASMSGSGSAVFGIFKTKPNFDAGGFPFYLQEPDYSR
ncbi:MAG: 4-(cytidine 5'-diphospho)-2-C-methyl-D-erythritol kinase [Sphingobacteriaceae bacterium]|nr:4-(cytidine 5'-diphospho)-2-C-methyl-D-erythritol kinase [Sphingobacteriaceae bacterium]